MIKILPIARDEELQECSRENIRTLSQKHRRLLVLSTDEERKGFAEKFASSAAPKDLTVVQIPSNRNCELDRDLEMNGAPSAILLEGGKVKDLVPLHNDDVKDTATLVNLLSKKPSTVNSCKGEFVVTDNGWELEPEKSAACERQISNISKVGPYTRKYLTKHLK